MDFKEVRKVVLGSEVYPVKWFSDPPEDEPTLMGSLDCDNQILVRLGYRDEQRTPVASLLHECGHAIFKNRIHPFLREYLESHKVAIATLGWEQIEEIIVWGMTDGIAELFMRNPKLRKLVNEKLKEPRNA